MYSNNVIILYLFILENAPTSDIYRIQFGSVAVKVTEFTEYVSTRLYGTVCVRLVKKLRMKLHCTGTK